MNVPSIKKKRKVTVNVDYNNEGDEDIENLSASSKKVKVDS
jgi:hypothetical protein